MVMTPKSPRWPKARPWYAPIAPMAVLLAAITLVNILIARSGLGLTYWGGGEDCRNNQQVPRTYSIPMERRKLETNGEYAPLDLTVTFFCAPQPYEGVIGDAQRQALYSWMRLRPTPQIVLLGKDPTFVSLAEQFPGVISTEPDIDTSYRGLPQFHSLMARSMTATTNVSVFINADIILLGDFMSGLSRVTENFGGWVLTGMRWDMEELPFHFELPQTLGSTAQQRAQGIKIVQDRGTPATDADVAEYVQGRGELHTYGGVDFWAWNNVPGVQVPLFDGSMPPFNFGRGRYDNWLTHEIIESGVRAVVDGSDAVTAVHRSHNYVHVGQSEAGETRKVNFWSSTKATSWESYANVHLSQNYGTNFSNQLGTAQHIPWKLVTCLDSSRGHLCLLRRKRPGVCQCEHSPFVHRAQTDPQLVNGTRIWKCGVTSVDKPYVVEAVAKEKSPPGLPHTLQDLLPQVADDDKVVVLTGASMGYRELLMNFVCTLRRLGVKNLLVAAFDEDMYRFAFTQGLAVYYEPSTSSETAAPLEECVYGTRCFSALTKLKTRAALHVLQQGFHVLWSDVDVAWFRNPLPTLKEYGSGSLAVQSNEPDISKAPNLNRRINSGFYFARSSEDMVEAFADIVQQESASSLPEQVIFYDVLCGKNGTLRVGDEQCNYKGMAVKFLDRTTFPNGAVGGLWNTTDAAAACEATKCFVLHNNWISGAEAKKERFVSHKLWKWDNGGRMCIHKWHPSFARGEE